MSSQTKTSKRWLKEHFEDPYVKKAHALGYRSRAIFKLIELDEKHHLFKKGQVIVDLGAAPGGWTQYIAKKLDNQGVVFALDILPMDPLGGVTFLQGDFSEITVIEAFEALIMPKQVDIVCSDMAPNMSGNPSIDMPKSIYLCEMALYFAGLVLKPNGTLVMKIFHGKGLDDLIKDIRLSFKTIKYVKPKASRSRSRETYLIATGFGV
jgi:23S rRNA (uridine2552-2'-O)-methyltransferase